MMNKSSVVCIRHEVRKLKMNRYGLFAAVAVLAAASASAADPAAGVEIHF